MYGGGLMPGQRAGSGVTVQKLVHCRAPKTGQQKKRFNSITQTIHFAHLCILFINDWMNAPVLLVPRIRKPSKKKKKFCSSVLENVLVGVQNVKYCTMYYMKRILEIII